MNSIYLSKTAQRALFNSEYLQFQKQVRSILAGLPAAALTSLARVLGIYDPVLQDMESVFVQDQRLALTAQVEAQDRLRDRLLSGLMLMCRSQIFFPVAANSDAANTLLHAIGIYGENIQDQSYNAETASINNLLSDLATKPVLSAALTTIGAAPWIAPLKAANQQFDTLYQQRTADIATTALPFNMKEKRVEMMTAYETLTKKIAGMYEATDGAAPWNALTDKLHALNQQYIDLLAAREGRNEPAPPVGPVTPPPPAA